MGAFLVNDDLYAVFDSGPLIHLSEVGVLHILDLFKQKVTSDIILSEVGRYISKVNESYLRESFSVYSHNAKLVSDQLATIAKIYSLDYGEISALALINSLKPEREILFFSDDSAARMAAEGLGIASVGTIGIVVKSATEKIIGKENALKLLESIPLVSSLYIKSDLLKSIIIRLRKEWEVK